MSFRSPHQSHSDKYRILVPLGVATTALFWFYGSTAIAQNVPEFQTAQNSGTEVASQTQLFVNPTQGNDSSGNGSESAPFKTITQALRQAKPNTTIRLSPGTYSAESGESFPLILKPQVALEGDTSNRGRGIIIRGGGLYLSRTSARQNVGLVAADGARVSGITLTNDNTSGYALWVESASMEVTDNTFTRSGHDGISVVGNSAPTIRSNHFVENGANGITIYGTSRPQLVENVFERTGFGISIGQKAEPILTGNQVRQNRDGVVIHGTARPVLRNNQIESNQDNGVVAVGNSRPDMGTSGDPGGNVVRNNGQMDINCSATKEIVPAFGNQVASDRTSGRLDLNGTLAPVASAPVTSTPPRPLPLPLPRPAGTPAPTPPATPASFPSPTATTPQPPPPLSATVSLPVPTPGQGIPIPVPPPQTGTAPAPRPPAPAPAIGNRPGDTLPNLLPVPDGNPPIGNGGAGVPVVGAPSGGAGNGPPTPPSRAAALGLRYRVIVNATSSSDQARVRRVVSDAFRTRINGRMVMQVGAFATQDKVDEMMQLLQRNGLTGVVLDIE
ncbi:DUF1565 domain-containing protein [Laspinema sp. D1]|uniref:DUF1565 domain-containing protein n=1 Tax=Laspinema palackyanum D2a TaxID=2953684 RepID=A0ABT2MRJ5_9CYAN|nr:DUF1565 domain-containing protein [Laspinema sp. D2b]MCT7967369.1 DUF1565 domain-containing protein [Laspinema sp. D2a]